MVTALVRRVVAISLVWTATMACAQTATTFTYQGRLEVLGAPYTGTADYRFSLWDAASAGGQIGTTFVAAGVDVSTGLFTAGIDFGAEAHGPGRFLQIEVRAPAWDGQGAEPAFFTFPDRTPLTPAPFAPQTRGIFVNETGDRVGIGTTTPTASLDVAGGIRARGGPPGALGGNTSGYAFRGNGGDNDSGMFSGDDGVLQFFTNDNERVRIGPSGNVGIGTTDPQRTLDIFGNIRIDGVNGVFEIGGSQSDTLVVAADIELGSGSEITFADGSQIRRNQIVASRTNAALDFGPIGGGGRSALFGTLSGAMPGDVIILSVNGDVPFPFILFGEHCPAPNQFRALFHNVGGSTVDPPPFTFSVIAIRP